MTLAVVEEQVVEEQDIRVDILNSLLSSPHRDVSNLLNLHNQMSDQDPLFYGHLAAWAQENIDIRDHKDLFVAKLFVSDFPELREAAYVLIQSFPPFRINRVIDHIKGKTTKTPEGKSYEKRFGKNLPRIFRSAIQKYLKTREEKTSWFDSCVLANKKSMVSLYTRTRIKPGNDHVRAALFGSGSLEKGSNLESFRQLVKEGDSEKQAKIIVKNKIPYMAAIGAVDEITPAILVALINSMTSQELVVNMNSLKNKGALDNADVKSLISKKLKEAQKDSKIDVMKGSHAAKNISGLDEETKQELQDITDNLVKNISIDHDTALIIDKSMSMSQAIGVAKQIGSAISGCINEERDFYCYAFDTISFKIDCRSSNLSDWEDAMKMIKASGGTAIGSPIVQMTRNKEKVDQIVIVSDFGEMSSPKLVPSLIKYIEEMSINPYIVMVVVDNRWESAARRAQEVRDQLNAANIENDSYNIEEKFDYYSLPTLLRFLSRKSKYELAMEIMSQPLPKKSDLAKKC